MTDTQQELFNLAQAAYRNAYCPYSNFPVGCAVRTKEGKYFAGTNVENVAYGVSKCAESAAIGAMVTTGYREIVEIMIYTESKLPCLPCGACRQQISEFATAHTLVYSANLQGIRSSYQLGDLLPEAFGLLSLELNA
jgi:cytidine deaminase